MAKAARQCGERGVSSRLQEGNLHTASGPVFGRAGQDGLSASVSSPDASLGKEIFNQPRSFRRLCLGACVFLGRGRISEPTDTPDRWFLSVGFPEAVLLSGFRAGRGDPTRVMAMGDGPSGPAAAGPDGGGTRPGSPARSP